MYSVIKQTINGKKIFTLNKGNFNTLFEARQEIIRMAKKDYKSLDSYNIEYVIADLDLPKITHQYRFVNGLSDALVFSDLKGSVVQSSGYMDFQGNVNHGKLYI